MPVGFASKIFCFENCGENDREIAGKMTKKCRKKMPEIMKKLAKKC